MFINFIAFMLNNSIFVVRKLKNFPAMLWLTLRRRNTSELVEKCNISKVSKKSKLIILCFGIPSM